MRVAVLTDDPAGARCVVPALEILALEVVARALTGPLDQIPDVDCVLIDGRTDLGAMVEACRSDHIRALQVPVFLVAPLQSLAVLKATWGFDDWVLPDCTDAELATRLRLSAEAWGAPSVTAGAPGLEIDPETYRVAVDGRPLDLTYTEFELLRALVSAPGRVWTRASLLNDVWGYTHAGGTRTVDVHVRRLRAKLGPDLAACIQTVRKVGYKFVPRTAGAHSGERDAPVALRFLRAPGLAGVTPKGY